MNIIIGYKMYINIKYKCIYIRPLVCWAKRLRYKENFLLYYFSPIPPSTSTAEYN